MSMSDPIADMLTRIRNAHLAKKKDVEIPFSRTKEQIADVLKQEGYIENFEILEKKFKHIRIQLKYIDDRPAIILLKRISRPGLRIYRKVKELPVSMNGFGTIIVSTSKGLLSDRKAKELGHGGEIICMVE